jgi:hypothetical protein
VSLAGLAIHRQGAARSGLGLVRYVLTAAAFLATLVVVGAATIFAVLAFAGPHSDMLPKPLQILVYVLAWAVLLGLPALAARAAWRRTG